MRPRCASEGWRSRENDSGIRESGDSVGHAGLPAHQGVAECACARNCHSQAVAPRHGRRLCEASGAAHGCSRQHWRQHCGGLRCFHEKRLARFLDNSIKSANETEGHLLKARDLGLISLSEWEKYSAETIEVRKMIFGYCGKVRASAAKGDKSADK